ncbi:MAG: cobalt-precorrin-5B (C(1))-methyltransferase [Pseudomonadota bacterium]
MTDKGHELSDDARTKEDGSPLRRGWTTGACATAATKSALHALYSGAFEDPVSLRLPKGEEPSFALASEARGHDYAEAGIIKDAGDDPDVTHGALILARVKRGNPGSGVIFKGGVGVGQVTRPGLPLSVGEPAINPIPRQMMSAVVEDLAVRFQESPDVEITISVPDGERLAEKTWNPRLGIIGGLSILGTTGVVHPYSCSAWIHSIHRGIDVANAEGLHHVAGATGSTSEKVVQTHYDLPDHAMLDMGDFAGGLLKYLRRHPRPRLTIGGGFAKLTKLAQGYLDLHSSRSQVDFEWLAERASEAGVSNAGAEKIAEANTATHGREIALEEAVDLAPIIARRARETALKTLHDAPVVVDVMVIDRQGVLIAHEGPEGSQK